MSLRSIFISLLAGVAARPVTQPAKPVMATDDDILIKNQRATRAYDEAITALRGHAQARAQQPQFFIQEPMPGVIPAGKRSSLATDQNIRAVYKRANDSTGLAASGTSSGMISYAWGAQAAIYNGYTFLGYPFLAQLSQIVEFRKPCEIIANEMTREWLTVVSKSEDDDKLDRIKQIEAELDRIGAREAFRKAYETDNLFGIGMIYPKLKGVENVDLDKPLIPDTIEQGSLEGLRCLEPLWNYPGLYNTVDPLSDDFYKPTTWFVLSTEVHVSRLLTFIARPVPDILKPMYLFGGLALQQISEPYVRNWLETRQSVNRMIHTFSTMVFGTDMSQVLQPGGLEMLGRRVSLYNLYRSNFGLMVTDCKQGETMANVSAPLGTLDHLQAQAQEQQASAVNIPLVKMFGITPSGLNTSTDGEIRTFYDSIKGEQERTGTPQMRRLMDIVQLSLFGDIDQDITFVWNPLWSSDEKSASDLRKAEADRDVAYIEAGVLSPEEVRQRLADDEKSGYNNIDVDDVPDLLGEEEEGLEPEGGRPQATEAGQEERDNSREGRTEEGETIDKGEQT